MATRFPIIYLLTYLSACRHDCTIFTQVSYKIFHPVQPSVSHALRPISGSLLWLPSQTNIVNNMCLCINV